MKNKFEIPELTIVYFQNEDIITESGDKPELPGGDESYTDF